jgi:hypothetical protein
MVSVVFRAKSDSQWTIDLATHLSCLPFYFRAAGEVIYATWMSNRNSWLKWPPYSATLRFILSGTLADDFTPPVD